MGEIKGYTLLEVIIAVGIIGIILMVLLTTISLSYNTWFQLAEESQQSYRIRTITNFYYREGRMIDKSTIRFTNNGNRGRKLIYKRYNNAQEYTLEVSINNSLYWRRDGSVYIIIENITFMDFIVNENNFVVKFRINSKDYRLVVPW
ncbi:prepilin-type N-terminal cleavage/methylation domain-containing protein [Anaerobranca californiensis DSM 14826]|jgi:prepilin-type N-terminal cleavage/methylation domain-containing protein|uniref:Prepilin-type N-terminal cleavage/methylation domain-containing protein n=1 Tax=Anaerobranca californiensis DSM 14826 TaxID=1120989 RepID=A0A1M6LC69_9FIRM|nr:prepilin-type N-terminal cleavage/methylation domain-containing protein [Anaerobranca californiensis]SHJ68762.1 prepilin-type N-terminal cleavage/methylation domain-containing protein [Anaerobranca californiensis DSM 14826]